MSGSRALAILAALLCIAGACGIDPPRSAARGPCTSDTDTGPDCEPVALASAEDACWRLVQCGALPVANPESDPTCCFDWGACVNHVDSLPDEQFEMSLACIEASTCDDLKPGSGGGLPHCVDLSSGL